MALIIGACVSNCVWWRYFLSAFSTEVNDRYAMYEERIVLYAGFLKVVMKFLGAFRFLASCK